MTETARYSGVDRLLHRLAFSGVPLQRALADMEDRLFASSLDGVAADHPVFIAGLPRAGTTHLLNILATSEELATNSYRDMPFVLAPLLWDRFSRRFRKPGVLQERPHGDGVTVGYDSPEAFEEAVWLTFWPQKYRSNRIDLWTASDRDPEFEAFFAQHMCKVAALRAGEGRSRAARRYLSKNNANIARLRLLPTVFPNCRIVVPFRDPLSHALSLQSQHRRFRRIHAEDSFARRYMSALGHFEFGADLKPIAFGSTFGSPNDPTFWLRYWIAVHEFFETTDSDSIVFVDYADLCDHPEHVVLRLTGAIDVELSETMKSIALRTHSPRDYQVPKDQDFENLLPRAQGLYTRLQHRTGVSSFSRVGH